MTQSLSKRKFLAAKLGDRRRDGGNTTSVAAALTRARQARLPSPWTEAVDFLCFPQSHARKCSTFLLARAPRSRKSTASGQGEGSEMETREGSKKFTNS